MWEEGGNEPISGHAREKSQMTVEIMENNRTTCYCAPECANVLLYILNGERELLELHAQYSRK